jgi:cell wall-associated NlpC family hydrolase
MTPSGLPTLRTDVRGAELGRAIVEKAREYVGKNYRHQGRGPHHYDCIGLAACVARELGLRSKDGGQFLANYDLNNYRRGADGRVLYRELRRHLHLVPTFSEARDGDVLMFLVTFLGNGWVHAAFLSDGGQRMIHASDPRKGVIEHVLGEKWAKPRAIFRFDEAVE